MYLFFSSKSLHPIGYSTFPALRWLRLIATIEPLAPPPSRYTGENAWHNKKLFERCPVEQCCGSESVLIRVLIFHIRIIRIRIQVLVCAENFQWVKHRHKSLVLYIKMCLLRSINPGKKNDALGMVVGSRLIIFHSKF